MYKLSPEQQEVLHNKQSTTAKAGRELCPGINAITSVQIFHVDMVERLFKPIPDKSMMLLHGVVGISGEAGELLDAVKKHVFYEKPLDTENVIEELGDLLFYITAVANLMGVTLTELLSHNAVKLQLGKDARYATGQFSNQQASDRADKKN